MAGISVSLHLHIPVYRIHWFWVQWEQTAGVVPSKNVEEKMKHKFRIKKWRWTPTWVNFIYTLSDLSFFKIRFRYLAQHLNKWTLEGSSLDDFLCLPSPTNKHIWFSNKNMLCVLFGSCRIFCLYWTEGWCFFVFHGCTPVSAHRTGRTFQTKQQQLDHRTKNNWRPGR